MSTHENGQTPITYSPPREVTPIPGQENARVERLPTINERLQSLELGQGLLEIKIDRNSKHGEQVESSVARIEDKLDGHFATLLQAVVDNSNGSLLRNPKVQGLAGLGFLLLLAAAVGQNLDWGGMGTFLRP